ncbi:MAG: Beta-galactosidase C-terminal domain [Paludibaculum sp.]
MLSDELQKRVVDSVLRQAGLDSPDRQLPATVHVKHGTGNSGHAIHYYFNYSGSPQSFAYPYSGAVDLLTGKTVAKSQQVTVPAWDVIIAEER